MSLIRFAVVGVLAVFCAIALATAGGLAYERDALLADLFGSTGRRRL